MRYPDESTKQSETIRIQTAKLLKSIKTKASEFELPKPSTLLESYHQKLLENKYEVLVVGEAKRGKSTFVNALIGQSILPTDVDIATSQVFHINQANQEAYRIRFEDESTREIPANDLALYGSQVVIDARGKIRLDQIIRWIEVDVPIQLLPKGMSILDTPGLGSLYGAHTQITHRFVPYADAVIYVLDSRQPIGQPDIEFIEKIIKVTKNIFFIQTRIDQFGTKVWRANQKRNQELLAERFGNELNDTNVWPVSGTHLLKGVEINDEDYVNVSGYPELNEALQNFLFRVAGWGRVAEAIVVADHYHITSHKALSARLASVKDTSQDNKLQLQQLAAQRQQQFETNWSESGAKRQSLILGIEKVIYESKQSFMQALQPNGEIEQIHRDQIRNLNSTEEAERFGQQMISKVVETTVAKLRNVDEQRRKESETLLAPFLITVEFLNIPIEFSQPHLHIDDPIIKDTERRGGPFAAMGRIAEALPIDSIKEISGIFGEKVLKEGTSVLFRKSGKMLDKKVGLPVSDFILPMGDMIFDNILRPTAQATLSGLWGLAQSASQGLFKKKNLRDAKMNLEENLSKILSEIRSYFLEADPVDEISLIDKQYDTFLQTTSQYIETIVKQKSIEVEAEVTRLKEEAQLSATQRQAKEIQLLDQLQEWNEIGVAIQSIEANLERLRQPSTPNS